MQIVIDIPEVYYEALRKTDRIVSGQRGGKTLMSVIYNAVAEGTPLPKGHGTLKDVECVKKQFNGKEGDEFTAFHFYEALDNAPTLIQADDKREYNI